MLQRLCVAAILFAATAVAAQPPGAPGKPLPPGPMQAKVKAACTSCHNITRITQQHMSRQKWSDQLDKMEGLGAVISDADRNPMLDYLAKNFGREKGSAKEGEKTASKKPGPGAN